MAGQEGTQRDPYDLSKNPDLEELLRVLERRIKLHIRTSCPANVVTFNPALATVNVLVGNLQVTRIADPLKLPKAIAFINPPRGEVTLAPILIQNVPVEYPSSGAGKFTFPILPNDTGMLTITDRSLETWKLKGSPTDPVLAATHALEDSVFRPGLRSLINAIGVIDMTATVIDGTSLVKIGANAIDFVALATKVLTELTAIKTAYDTHTHMHNPGPSPLAPTAVPIPLLPTPGSVAAIKAQAE